MTDTNITTEQEQPKKDSWKEFIPRKIAGAIAAMWLLGSSAKELKDLHPNQFYFALGCMAIVAILGIWTHYLLERGAKLKKIPSETVLGLDKAVPGKDESVVKTVEVK